MKPLKLIVDAQLLVLYIVGRHDRGLIGQHRRCSEFDDTDFDVLDQQIALASEMIFLPHVLAEASNLLRLIGDPIRAALSDEMSRLIESGRESHVQSAKAARHPRHRAIGLTDCSLLIARRDATILTKDFDLYRAASNEGRKVINFTHLRERFAPRF